MRLAGHIHKNGRRWTTEILLLDLTAEATTRAAAYRKLSRAVEALSKKPHFEITVHPTKGTYFEIDATDDAALFALVLKRRRAAAGLSLADVAKRLGLKSRSSYARYEQGRDAPSVGKVSKLLHALDTKVDIVLRHRRVK
jgi:DNA-binding XRE family transcriptional regulator